LTLKASFHSDLPKTRIILAWLKSILPFFLHILVLIMNSLIFRLLVKLTLYGLPLDVSEGPPLVILSGEIFRLVILSIMTTDLPLFIIVALTDVTSLLGLLFNEATAPQVLLPLALLQALAPAHFH
jgi:hypothetical protein